MPSPINWRIEQKYNLVLKRLGTCIRERGQSGYQYSDSEIAALNNALSKLSCSTGTHDRSHVREGNHA
jgi:hypothetical protein